MVQKEECGSTPMPTPSYHIYNVPKTSGFRKFTAVLLIILLYTAATPFTPAAWLNPDNAGSFLIDRVLAGGLLFAAMFFQWQIACQSTPTPIILPTGSRTMIRNGVIVPTQGDMIWLFEPSNYGQYAIIEGAALLAAEYAGWENMRRIVASLIVAGLWIVGWSCTSDSTKKEGWEYMKKLWFWIALDEFMKVGRGGGGVARRRKW